MSRKTQNRYDDDFEFDEVEDTETLISRNKPPRYKSAPAKKTKKSVRRPGSPNKAKPKLGKDLWMNAIKKRQTLGLANGRHPDTPHHKTPIEFWVDTLRKTGMGKSQRVRGNAMTGLKKGNDMNLAYFSTSHYMRQMMGTEKARRNVDDPTARTHAGTPAYKTPEEYYDDILDLKKHISSLSQDNSTMKAKVRRLEEDNIKKEKEIDGLLHPEKNEELRRTMGDRKPDTGAVIHSLKQKILKLEMQLRDKEASYVKLASELKTTKVEEMKVQMEVLYQELLRLQNSKDTGADKSRSGKESGAKVKALNQTVLRLSKVNEQLQSEIRGLKEDLEKALEDTEEATSSRREYEDIRDQPLTSGSGAESMVLGEVEEHDGGFRFAGSAGGPAKNCRGPTPSSGACWPPDLAEFACQAAFAPRQPSQTQLRILPSLVQGVVEPSCLVPVFGSTCGFSTEVPTWGGLLLRCSHRWRVVFTSVSPGGGWASSEQLRLLGKRHLTPPFALAPSAARSVRTYEGSLRNAMQQVKVVVHEAYLSSIQRSVLGARGMLVTFRACRAAPSARKFRHTSRRLFRGLLREYEDMNKRQLLVALSKAERRAERAERKAEADNTSMLSLDSRRSEVQGKIVLHGSMEERLHQLDQRESELLDEIEKLKVKVRRLNNEMNKKSRDSSVTPRRRDSPHWCDSKKASSADSGRETKVQSFSQKKAAQSIQRQWRQHREKRREEEERLAIRVEELRRTHAARTIQRRWTNHQEETERMQNVNKFRQNHAAKAIQSRWRRHRQDEEDDEEAAYVIQSALRGHHQRRQKLKRYQNEEDYDDEDDAYHSTASDDAVYMIQSSLKGHTARRQRMRRMRLDSTGDDDYEDEGHHGYTGRRYSGSRRPSSALSRGSAKKTYATYPSSRQASMDDDDDIMT
ncbi:LOW QUALITY PROTEIN: uncharacterized protein LOC124262112 [Haliotis rubra]|uniref:LOW QUALITY PROTEIN: uncharacterized protein LOC124262112 n=1 Tax=Haliotis rubra TaxID=36100 RepID=UPI001EE52FD2|nr:LOW QUALITY PROTEIN: uncharacterized protein LOC124262112 [Haliotis rubra]